MPSRRPRFSPARWAAAGLVTWLLHVGAASAQPSVRIQADSRLELEGIDSGTAHGRLTDDLGQPLADRIIVLAARPDGDRGQWQRASAKTAYDGRFRVTVGRIEGEVELSATYAGDRLQAPTRAAGRFDPRLAPVRLRLTAPALGRVDLDDETFVIRVAADSRAGGAGLALSIQDDAGRNLASGATGADGSFESVLPTQLFDPPGPHLLVVRGTADARRGAAQIEQPLIGYLRTKLELRAEHDTDGIVLRGELSTSRGPLARKAIGIFVDGTHLATIVTDDAGRYRHVATQPPEGVRAERELQVQARFDSDGAWLAGSRSPSLALTWRSRSISHSLWLLAATTSCALLVLVWSSRNSRRQRRPAAPPQPRGPGIHALGARTRGRAHDSAIAGIVLDARSGLPVKHARIVLDGPDGAMNEVVQSDDGRFEALAPGRGTWRLSVSASGYAAQSQAISIPHHGAWANVQVFLPSLRWAAIEAFRPAAERVLPSPHLWGQWTLREIHDSAARSGRGGGELERATELTELTAYGPLTPGLEQIEDIDRAVAVAGLTPSTKNDQSG